LYSAIHSNKPRVSLNTLLPAEGIYMSLEFVIVFPADINIRFC